MMFSFSAYAGKTDQESSQNAFKDFFSFLAPKAKDNPSSSTAALPTPKRKPGTAQDNQTPKTPTTARVYNFEFTDILSAKPAHKPLPKDSKHRLSDKDKELYQKIFTAQSRGDWKNADKQITKLSDLRLLGYIAYHRYMHPKYITSKTELENWLNVYGHYAVADDVYRLAKRKFGAVFKRPQRQKTLAHKVVLSSGQKTRPYRSTRQKTSAQRQEIKALQRSISSLLSRDAPTKALDTLQKSPAKAYMDDAQYDILKADIAAAYFYLQLFDKAEKLAVEAVTRSGRFAPMSGWIAGLCAWEKQDYARATDYFKASATSPRSSDWMRSGAAYWAARSALRNKNPHAANQWLKMASKYPRSFYGLIAMQSLGFNKHEFDWSLPSQNDDAHIRPILQQDTGYRAIALLDAGQQYMASEELQTINISSNNRALKEGLFVLASRYNMPGLSMQLASSVKRENGALYDTALYPLSPWQPHDGFVISPALIHAFIRQESRFHPRVESRSGAHGLMQLMPTTASYLAKKPKNFFKQADGQDLLMEPQYNMTLGQEYLRRLLGHSSVDNNLFKLAAAYNAGPGRLKRWTRKMEKNGDIANDPLLFIEMLPALETRNFVEKVMTNYWIYNLRFHGKMPDTLRAAASGKWPSYAQDNPVELAEQFARPKRTRAQ